MNPNWADRYPAISYELVVKKQCSYKDDLSRALREWKNKYEGERIFIIGNGPSLNKTPLDKLIGEYSFATNNIAKMYPRTEWRPSFYSAITTNIRTWIEPMRETIELGIPSFVWWKKAGIGNYPNIWWTDMLAPDTDAAMWQDDITKGLMKFGSSLMPCIQIAMYMGFKKMYFVGCDLGFKARKRASDSDQDHFDEDYWCGSTMEITQKNADRWNTNIALGHLIAREKGKERGIELYNATIGGELEVHPRVRLEDIL